MFTHALHYLKEGLDNNEAVLLVTDLFSINMAHLIMSNLWGKDCSRYWVENKDFSIVNISKLTVGSKSVSGGIIIPLIKHLSESVLEKRRRGFRIFADLGVMFQNGLIKRLMECESDFQTMPDSLKIVCGYLQSEIIDLNSKKFAYLQQRHNNVYVIP
jgi:hypothetical protein